MEISLYNDTGAKVFATVNGIEYIIKPQSISVARCVAGMPVKITLSRKMKSFAILNLFDIDNGMICGFWESATILILNPTYILNINGDNNQYFRICSDTFSCDKYYDYDRLYLDDPIIKNDCTYEIARQKKIKKRVKLFNVYTTFIVIALLCIAFAFIFEFEHVKAGTFLSESEFVEEFMIGMLFGLAGVFGKIKVLRRYKKVTDEDYIQQCFRGYIEEIK